MKSMRGLHRVIKGLMLFFIWKKYLCSLNQDWDLKYFLSINDKQLVKKKVIQRSPSIHMPMEEVLNFTVQQAPYLSGCIFLQQRLKLLKNMNKLLI